MFDTLLSRIATVPGKAFDLLSITMRPLSQLFEPKAHRGLPEHGGGVRRNLPTDGTKPHLLDAPDGVCLKGRDYM